MADLRAVVAGPASYVEIGGGGTGSDYLVVGGAGIKGTASQLDILAGGTGDKTIVVGEQGTTTANVVHVFGTADGSLNGTLNVHGNLRVAGTEDVIGSATFTDSATFNGDVTFGDASGDTVTFVADVDSDIYFDAAVAGRTIGVRVPTTGAGTDLTISSGAAFGAGNDDGGNVLLVPANPTGTGDWGAVKIGSASEIDPVDAKQGPRMLLNTGSPGEAGFRWNSTDSKLQYKVQSGAWTDLVGGGGVLPPSTDQYQILQANAGGGWNVANFLTLPNTAGAAGRSILIEAQTTANIAGDALTVAAADGNGTGAGGALNLEGGDAPGTGATGAVAITSQAHTTGTTGSVTVDTGSVTSGTAGSIDLTAGSASSSGSGGDISLTAGDTITGGSAGDVAITAGGTTGANGGTNGGAVTVTGGSTDDGTGGSVTVAGGAASGGTNGGGVYVNGGNSATGTDGTVYLGNANTTMIELGVNAYFESTANHTLGHSDIATGKANALEIVGSGSPDNDGGDVSVIGGSAALAGAGGQLSLTAGANSLGTGSGGDLVMAAGYSAVTGGDAYLDAGQGVTTNGTIYLGTNYGEIVFGPGGADDNVLYANTDTPADRAGIRYNDTLNQWEYHEDGGGATWTPFGSGSVPDGTIVEEHLRWSGTAWLATTNLWMADQANVLVKIIDGDTQGRIFVGGQSASSADTSGGEAWLGGGDATGIGTAGDAHVVGGGGTGTGAPGDVYIDGGNSDSGTQHGNIYIGTNDSDQIVFGDGGATTNALYANTDTAADRAGIRYNDTLNQWEYHEDGGGATWTPFGSGAVPDGTVTGEILSWNQGTTSWDVAQDLALAAGADRAIGMQPHTAASAANALVVSGQENTSVGPGTTTGGQLTVKGGDSTAEHGGDLILTGGNGNSNNGNVLFGDGTNGTNIDFENTTGNRIISDIVFADTAAGSTYSIKTDNSGSGPASPIFLIGGNGAAAVAGTNGAGLGFTSGSGGPTTTGTGGNGGNQLFSGGNGGGGGTGTAGDGANFTFNAGDGGTAGTVAGGQGGTFTVNAGAGTGNVGGGEVNLTGGAAVGTTTAGDLNFTGGANSSTGPGGTVYITGGTSTSGNAGGVVINGGAGTSDGSVTIGGSDTNWVIFGAGANTVQLSVGASPPVLEFNGTSTIDLPGTAAATNNFRIQTVAVGDTVTAPNLDTLTAGSTSDATALHTHDGLGSVSVVAGEALTVNMCVSTAPETTTNAPRAYACNTTSTPGGFDDGPLPVGFATETVAAAGTSTTLKTSGEITIPAALWQVQPSVTDVGKPVFAYTAVVGGGGQGSVSLTPPASGTGDWRTKVGVITSVVATVSATISIQIGDNLLMA